MSLLYKLSKALPKLNIYLLVILEVIIFHAFSLQGETLSWASVSKGEEELGEGDLQFWRIITMSCDDMFNSSNSSLSLSNSSNYSVEKLLQCGEKLSQEDWDEVVDYR